MDHMTHTRLNDAELSEGVLKGAPIYGPDNESVGHVSEVHGSGAEARVVVDVGGFLGIGAKRVTIAARDLDFMREESGVVHAVTRWSKEALKALPE